MSATPLPPTATLRTIGRRRFVFPSLLRNPLALFGLLWIGLLVVLSILAPVLPLQDPLQQNLTQTLQLPSAEHILGTDTLGRDVFSRIIWGTQPALLGAALAVVTALILGATLGVIAGYVGGWFNAAASRFADLIFSLPAMVVLLALAAVFGPSTAISMISFGVLLSASYLRLAQASTIAVRRELYVDAAKVMGFSTPRIIGSHIVRNVAGPVIVQISLTFGVALMIQASLGFLGLGPPPPTPDWGGMIAEASNAIFLQPWLMVPTGVVLSLTILSANLIGDAIRDGSAMKRPPSVLRRDRKKTGTLQPLQMSSPESLLEVSDLTVTFPSPDGDSHVVRNASFSVDRGEIVALVGESGSGKTMTALSIMGLLPFPGTVTSGQIRFAEVGDLVQASEAQMATLRGSQIGLISQEPMVALDPCYTVAAQLLPTLRRHRGLDRGAARAAARQLLGEVGLRNVDDVLASYPHQLSGGMAQRVAIAMALAGNPKLLIADEPTTALDVTVQAGILDLLRELQATHDMSIIIVTHDLGVVADVASRAVVMEHGQIVETATVSELFAAPEHEYTRSLIAATPSLVESEANHG